MDVTSQPVDVHEKNLYKALEYLSSLDVNHLSDAQIKEANIRCFETRIIVFEQTSFKNMCVTEMIISYMVTKYSSNPLSMLSLYSIYIDLLYRLRVLCSNQGCYLYNHDRLQMVLDTTCHYDYILKSNETLYDNELWKILYTQAMDVCTKLHEKGSKLLNMNPLQ